MDIILCAWETNVHRFTKNYAVSAQSLFDQDAPSQLHYLLQSSDDYLNERRIPRRAVQPSSSGRVLHFTSPPPPREAPPLNQPNEKRTRFNDSGAPSTKPTQAPPGRHILVPANAELSVDTLKSLKPDPMGHIYLHSKDGKSFTCKLCVPYLLGRYCDSIPRCGFHLDLDGEPLKRNDATARFAQLRAWILQHKAFIRLSPIAINTLALRP